MGLGKRKTGQGETLRVGIRAGCWQTVLLMNITASFHGILADWIGVRSASFDLPTHATHGDLLKAIHQRYAQNMPDQLWDQTKNRFAKEITISGKGEISKLLNVALKDDEVVIFLLMIAGG
jgi:hypothetical protein